MHLVYFRFAFPVWGEPGPKRPLEIIERYRNKGHRVTVITSSGNFMTGDSLERQKTSLAFEEKDGITFVRTAALARYRSSMGRRLANYGLFTILALWAGLRTIKGRGDETNIFVDISPPFAVLGGYLLSRLRPRAKLVLEITDLPESIFEIGMFQHPFWQKLTIAIFKWIYRAADRIVALTPGARTHIENQGIASEKMAVVTNWASIDDAARPTEEEREAIRKEFGWDGKFVILYAGGHGQAYDLLTLIKAAALLPEEKGLKVAFIGEGERKKEYVEYCRENGIDNCDFHSAVPRARLQSVLNAADVCANLFYKGDFWKKVIGHKIFDYFEARRAILFTGSGDTADIIVNAKGGMAIPPEDPQLLSRAIKSLLDDPREAHHMGERGYQYLLAEYGKEKVLARLDPVFGVSS